MIDANTMTLATQMALRELKQKLHDEGCKATDERMYGLRRLAAAYVRAHPELLERATERIATHPAFAKFRTSAQRRGR